MSDTSPRVTVQYGFQRVYPTWAERDDFKHLFLNQEELDALADAIGAGTYPYAAPAEYREKWAEIRQRIRGHQADPVAAAKVLRPWLAPVSLLRRIVIELKYWGMRWVRRHGRNHSGSENG
jgi:hypothetical protein